jgi:hypothetical protein
MECQEPKCSNQAESGGMLCQLCRDKIDLECLTESIERYDQMPEEEVDSDEYEWMLGRIVELRSKLNG